MGLFDKKNCSFCGVKVGMLDKKLADGHICKECRKKLSPYYEVSKNLSKAEVAEHLAQREENYRKLDGLEISDIYGEFGAILIDQTNRKFLALRDTSTGLFKSAQKVSSIEDVKQFNPDIFDLDQIVDVDIDIIANEREEKRTVDGEQVSFDPPEFTYMCQFALEIKMDHPYVSLIRVPLNSGSIMIRTVGRRKRTTWKDRMKNFIFDTAQFDIDNNAALYEYNGVKDALFRSKYDLPDYSFGFKVSMYNEKPIKEYQHWLVTARKICRQLMPERAQ